MPVLFKDLDIGDRFEFSDHSHYWPMEPGPWVKSSVRKYYKDTTPFGSDNDAREHREWSQLSGEVGTIWVGVIRR